MQPQFGQMPPTLALDHRGLEAELGGPDSGSDIAARPCPDDDDVEGGVGHVGLRRGMRTNALISASMCSSWYLC